MSPNDHLKLSPAGQNLIKHFEGCLEKSGDRYRAYKCPAGVLTIGFGTTRSDGGHQFDSASRWTLQECHDAFIKDMATHERNVRELVKVPLTAYRYNSLVSFCYNCGKGNLAKSTLLKYVNAQEWDKAALEFHKWNKGGGKVLPGLVRRRASEALLFQNISDLNYDGKPDKVIAPPLDPMPQAVDEPTET